MRVCLVCNHRAGATTVAVLRLASKLGDGPLWVTMVPLLWILVGGESAVHLLGSLATSGVLYRLAKKWTGRARPHVVCPEIRLLESPLDRYSFPSGHTLHALAATLVVSQEVPGAGIVLWPLTCAIALSRVALGLHYPSDVLAGAALGGVIGLAWS